MLKKLLLSAFLLSALSQLAIGQCRCPERRGDLAFSNQFERGPKVIICGHANRDISFTKVWSYSNISVIDCRKNKLLFTAGPETTRMILDFFRFSVKDGRVIIDQILNLPSEPGWKWAAHPFFELEISCKDGILTISDWRNIFVIPKKTKEEIESFLDAYENHFEQPSKGDPLYLPHKLMLCALNGSLSAERLLISFPQDHPEIYDGAVAENHDDVLYIYKEILKMGHDSSGRTRPARPHFMFLSCPGPPTLTNFGMRASTGGSVGNFACGSVWYQ